MPQDGYGHTKVTVDDGKGPAETAEVKDNYLLITDGDCYLDGYQTWANGTTQLIIKRGKRE